MGRDERDPELEIIAIELEGDEDHEALLLVIHVMPTHLRGNDPCLNVRHPASPVPSPSARMSTSIARTSGLTDGTRLTDEVADRIVDQVRRSSGRPSLSGEAAASPQIAFRVASAVRDRAAELAAREGKTISQLAREALEERIAASQ